MELESIGITYWILLLAIALIFGIIGFFVGKAQGPSQDIKNKIENLSEENSRLQDDLNLCQENIEKLSSQAGRQEYHFDANKARTIFGRFIKQDDLKIVEGIGPKIEGLFHNYNIKTWEALSRTSVAKCYQVLESGGEKYRVHDPASWPMQAKMCYQGKWKELYRWQEEHKHGKL